jgi:hypothetical protein
MRWVDGVKMDFSEAEFGSVYWTDPPLVVVQLLVFNHCSSSGFVTTWLINYCIVAEVHTKAWRYDWNMSQAQTEFVCNRPAICTIKIIR